MQRATIKGILNKKVNSWLETLPENLREKVRPNVIVTGGAITSLLMNERVNDFDIYFKNVETVKLISEYYVEEFKRRQKKDIKFRDGGEPEIYIVTENDVGDIVQSTIKKDSKLIYDHVKHNVEKRVKIIVRSSGAASETEDVDAYRYFEGINPSTGEQTEYVNRLVETVKTTETENKKGEYRPIFLTTNAITLSDDIQLVMRFFGEPDEIHKNYDFVHCTCYYDHNNKYLNLPSEALEAILDKRLYYVGSKYPLCSLFRMRKFIERGWKISAGQILKCALQISDLDLTNIKVLEDQLTGVDVAYFYQLIDAIKLDIKDKGGTGHIDKTYIMELVDKIL